MPPNALCSAIVRMRRPMWKNSSTLSSDESMMTAPAASVVTSLLWPKASPTVAATRAGASLMPSPMKSVFARRVSAVTMAAFSSGVRPAWTSVMPTRSAR